MVLLSVKHSHQRDSNISFEEETHSYYFDNSWRFPLSCTGFVHKFFNDFNADLIIHKMMKSKNWENSKYFGKTVAEIKQEWDINRDNAAKLGTLLHNTIEDFYNLETDEQRNVFQCDQRITQEFSYFMNYYNDFKYLKPFRTEMIVYSKELELAGSIDMLYIDEDTNELIVVDWKRSKDIKYTNVYQKGIGPCCDLDDTNYIHYSLQLNFYQYMLENFYGYKVKSLHLVVCHPDQANYIKIDVNDYQNTICKMLDVWRSERKEKK